MLKRGNKKGLSTIVATLIIILLVLVAVGMIWVVVRNVIQQGSEQVSLGKFTLDLKIQQVQVVNDSALNVNVKRNVGAGEFVGLIFIIEDDAESEIVNFDISLNELEGRTFNLNLVSVNASNIKKISIAPRFRLESGEEVAGDVKDEYQISTLNACSPVCTGKQCGSDGCGGTCGTCASGQNCLTNGTCSVTQCTDTCSSLGFSCGTRTVCGASINCGTCQSGFTCQTNGTCLANPCTDTCSSLGFSCGTRTVCGASVNCGTCASGSSCQTNGTCIVNPPTCTDTCSSLGFSCGTRTVCGVSTNCGTCASGSSCQTNGTCIAQQQGVCTDIVRDINFETGDLSQIGYGDYVNNVSVITSFVHSGTYAGRFASPPKADLRLWNITQNDTWLSFWMYVPAGYADGRWNMIYEVCPYVSPFCNVHVLLGVQDSNSVHNNVYLYFTAGLAPQQNYRSGISLPEDQWVHFVAYHNWDMTNGEITIWMNNQQIIHYTGRTMLMTSDPILSYEIGAYREPTYVQSPFYMDDIMICGHQYP